MTRRELRPHFEPGLGIALASDLPPGPVTLVRLGGHRLEDLFLAWGKAAPAATTSSSCRVATPVGFAHSGTGSSRAPAGRLARI